MRYAFPDGHSERMLPVTDLEELLEDRGVKALTDDDLDGHSIDDVKCRACSGYGNCGYKTFRLYNGKPYSVCNMELEMLLGDESVKY